MADPIGHQAPERTVGSILRAAIKQLRPKQWAKNVFLLPAVIFSGQFMHLEPAISAITAFFAFCMLASTGYILNDFLDREADRLHPKKKFRPIASGALPIPAAFVLMVFTVSAGVGLSLSLSPSFLAIGLLYLSTTLSYSFYFKHIAILDVLFLASGFVWRTIAGAIAIEVYVSEWLFLCTAFVALFFGFNKRRSELESLGSEGGTRKNLADYNSKILIEFQGIVTSGTIITYVLYTVQGPTGWMTLTVPMVLYAIFRYIYLVDQKGEGGAPDETLLKDRPILIAGVLYAVTAISVLVADKADMLPVILQ